MSPQQRRRSQGLCARCREEALPHLTLCGVHLVRHRVYMRKWAGWKPWKVGSPGYQGRRVAFTS